MHVKRGARLLELLCAAVAVAVSLCGERVDCEWWFRELAIIYRSVGRGKVSASVGANRAVGLRGAPRTPRTSGALSHEDASPEKREAAAAAAENLARGRLVVRGPPPVRVVAVVVAAAVFGFIATISADRVRRARQEFCSDGCR